MNSFRLNQQSSTLYSIVVMSSMLTCLPPSNSNADGVNKNSENKKYYIGSNSSTYSDYTASPQNFELKNNSFEQAIAGFYSKLLESQESLGEEFEEILFGNLWELYED